jgi:hypothetical protein
MKRNWSRQDEHKRDVGGADRAVWRNDLYAQRVLHEMRGGEVRAQRE